MSKRSAFTLIELLVVIAIIALLMSILLPALNKIKIQAKTVICMSNLHQWCLVMTGYTDDNRGLFPDWIGLTPGGRLKKYYKDEKLLLCPMAVKEYIVDGGTNPYAAMYYYEGLCSYGENTWILSKASANYQTDDRMWKTINVPGGYRIPMMFDCAGYENASPWHVDQPPRTNGVCEFGSSDNEMQYVCLDRHNMHVNMLFVDCSVRKVSLKELWELNWNRKWNIARDPPPDWPAWMAMLPDYWVE